MVMNSKNLVFIFKGNTPCLVSCCILIGMQCYAYAFTKF